MVSPHQWRKQRVVIPQLCACFVLFLSLPCCASHVRAGVTLRMRLMPSSLRSPRFLACTRLPMNRWSSTREGLLSSLLEPLIVLLVSWPVRWTPAVPRVLEKVCAGRFGGGFFSKPCFFFSELDSRGRPRRVNTAAIQLNRPQVTPRNVRRWIAQKSQGVVS